MLKKTFTFNDRILGTKKLTLKTFKLATSKFIIHF